MRSGYLPVILLLGAKSAHNPLASIPAELSTLKALLDLHKQVAPAFVPEYEPYFTQEHLKTKLDQLAGQVAVLHFAGHSDAEALMTDGAVVYAQHIAAILKTWRNLPALIFLNGCHNAGQVKLFHDAGVPVVIATRRAVDDGQAAGFAREFYASLFAEGGQVGVKDAFSRAGSKVLLGEKRQVRSLDIDTLPQADAEEWDWGLFAQRPEQEGWALRQLLTNERPRYDAKGELVNPYQGLKSFREEDRGWFFGREALTAELCEKIPATPLFTLLGASGSGKSSLISAGVIPALRETGDWLILATRPGFTELAEVFARVLYPDSVADRLSEQKKLAHKLQVQEIALPELVASVREGAGQARMLLFIDQFEELFTHAADQASVQAFQVQLISLVTAALPACHLLLVMRADFLSAALANPAFAEVLDKHATKFLGAMGQAELRAAIEKPASKQHVSIEPALTAALLDDVEHQPGSLPLLQYVLSLLWEQRRDHHIVLEDYNRLGGLEKALETRANDIFNHFSASEQEQVKGVFLRLIQPGEGTEDTRRRANLSEFSDNPAAQQIIKQLADERLVTTQQSDNREAAFAEVSHEALIRHWGKLREWLEASREILRTQHQVSAGAKAWEENQRDSAWLLSGSRLAVAEDWLEQHAEHANALEQEYIRVGVTERDRQAEEREQQRQRELALQEEKRVLAEQKAEEQRKSLQKTRRLSWVMAMIALVMIVAAGFAWHFANQSQVATLRAQEAATESRQRELDANYNLAKVFEEKAKNILTDKIVSGEEQATYLQWREAWLYGLEAAKQEVPTDKIAILPANLERLTAVSEQDLSTERKQTPALNIGQISALAYSPDGRVIATGGGDKTVRLWDASTGQALKTLSGHTDSVSALAYSPDGKMIASGSWDNSVRLWDASTGKELNTLSGHMMGGVSVLAYSPDGKVIASGSGDTTVRLWDAATGKELKTLSGHTGYVSALAYSPDGKVIASGGDDNAVRLWEASTGKELKTLSGHSDSVLALAYSPDGKVIASGSRDQTVRLWDAATGLELKQLSGHSDRVSTVAYSPDGKVIATGSEDKTVRLWEASTGKELKLPSGHTASVSALAYSPDGKVIASGGDDNAVRLWDASTGKELKTLSGHGDSVLALAYSPDGKVIASGSWDNTVRLWDASTGKELKTLSGHSSYVSALAYSPNGKMIATGSGDNTVRLWDAATGKELKTLSGHSSYVSELVYSPNGKVIATGSGDNTVRLWDAATGQAMKTFSGHSAEVLALAYSPDGKVIASGSRDKTVRLWDVDSPVFRLIYDFDPVAVSAALRFLWEMQRDGLQLKQQPHPPALFPQMGYHITFTDETRKLRPLLDAPRPDETKLAQVVRFLESQCAYKDPKQKADCQSKQPAQ